MKPFLLLLFIPILANSQKIADYETLDKAGDYDAYISRDGDTLRIGDKMTLGLPEGGSIFNWITQGDAQANKKLAGARVIIHKFKCIGKDKTGYKMYVLFKGYGLLPVYMDYEFALRTGEVEPPIRNQ